MRSPLQKIALITAVVFLATLKVMAGTTEVGSAGSGTLAATIYKSSPARELGGVYKARRYDPREGQLAKLYPFKRRCEIRFPEVAGISSLVLKEGYHTSFTARWPDRVSTLWYESIVEVPKASRLFSSRPEIVIDEKDGYGTPIQFEQDLNNYLRVRVGGENFQKEARYKELKDTHQTIIVKETKGRYDLFAKDTVYNFYIADVKVQGIRYFHYRDFSQFAQLYPQHAAYIQKYNQKCPTWRDWNTTACEDLRKKIMALPRPQSLVFFDFGFEIINAVSVDRLEIKKLLVLKNQKFNCDNLMSEEELNNQLN